jgi:hypothetical protein
MQNTIIELIYLLQSLRNDETTIDLNAMDIFSNGYNSLFYYAHRK